MTGGLQKNSLSGQKVSEILEVVMAYARLDFTKKTIISGNQSLDALGAGINMLGEELQSSTISLKEKEQLLKEIHHRVKNNLQIVSSLLNLQSESSMDEKYLELVRESRNRINSMALVHEMLYTSPQLSQIELKEYITRLASGVHHSFHIPDSVIQFHYKIEQELYFDIDRMIPVGLILNEIISNSLKYAFPKKTGNVYVELSQSDRGYSLSVSDDGIGLPDKFDVKKDANLGMQLIHMLAEQIGGFSEISPYNGKGTGYKIVIPV